MGRVGVMSEPVPAISVGLVSGGPGSSPEAVAAVKMLMRQVRDLREGLSSALHVNVVFHVPGDNMDLEFAGVRSSTFSRKQRALMVQAAMTPGESDPDAQARSLFREAVSLAADFAYQEGLVPTPELPELEVAIRAL